MITVSVNEALIEIPVVESKSLNVLLSYQTVVILSI
jgi:hypothetical protein